MNLPGMLSGPLPVAIGMATVAMETTSSMVTHPRLVQSNGWCPPAHPPKLGLGSASRGCQRELNGLVGEVGTKAASKSTRKLPGEKSRLESRHLLPVGLCGGLEHLPTSQPP